MRIYGGTNKTRGDIRVLGRTTSGSPTRFDRCDYVNNKDGYYIS